MSQHHKMGSKRRRNAKRFIAERDGGWFCFYCRKELHPAFEGEQPFYSERLVATIEHLKPLAHGGTNDRNNMVLSCYPCQRTRHAG